MIVQQPQQSHPVDAEMHEQPNRQNQTQQVAAGTIEGQEKEKDQQKDQNQGEQQN